MRLTGLAGLGGVTALAGCSGDGGDGSDGTSSTDGNGDGSSDSTSDGSSDGGSGGNGELEIIHHWTRGADGKAFSAFLTEFKNQHSDVRILENTIAGQAGSGVKTVITQRLLNSEPPSTFQGLAGKYMTPFKQHLDPIGDSVWSSNGMKDAYLQGPKEIAQLDGSYMMVPLNIHRVNLLFYNKSVVEQAGVDPTSLGSAGDLTSAMQKVENSTDAVGMAQSTMEPWTVLQLWETALLDEGGVEAYNKFANGNVAAVEGPAKAALERIAAFKDHFSSDANAIAWPEAASQITEGNAAFFNNGDWAAGVFLGAEDFAFGEDWDWIPFPGTENSFTVVMDVFAMPSNNPSPEATKKFLKFCGSKDGQRILNSIKGSIPPRTDVSTEEFSGYQKEQIESINNTDNQPGSMTHGMSVAPEPLTNLKKATGDFTSSWDVDATYDQFVSAFE